MQTAAQSQGTIPIREYQPNGGFGVIGVLIMAAALVLAGMVLGVAAHYISRMLWVVIIFPAGIGAGMGLAARAMVRVGKVRSPVIAGVLGFAGGCVAMFMMHYYSYGLLRSETAQLPAEVLRVAKLPESEWLKRLPKGTTVDQAAEAVEMLKMASVDSMLKYMNWRAHEGIRIGHGGDSGINLGFVGSWVYWICEVLIVAAITYAMTKGAARKPYCPKCDRWKVYRPLGGFTGPFLQAHEALRQGNVSTLTELGPVPRMAGTLLWVALCPQCGAKGDVELKLDMVTTGSKGQTIIGTMIECTTPGSSLAAIQGLFAPVASGPVAPAGVGSATPAT